MAEPARAFAAARGVTPARDEVLDPFGADWQLRDRRGFRPCPWAFDLARFTPARPGDRVVDLGCGNGVLLRALTATHPDLGPRVGVERVARSARQAARNARLCPHGGYHVLRADIRALPLRPRFDLVVTNPPFYPPGWGRQNPDDAHATHALHGDVTAFAHAASALLAPHGQAVFLYDADHLPALLCALADARLALTRLCLLDDDRNRPSRVLALAHKGAGLLTERRPYTGS